MNFVDAVIDRTASTMDIYLLPGLGADRRLFGKLELGAHRLHFIDWPEMPHGVTLADYARKLLPLVDASKPHVLVGVSMGGMVAQEMASMTAPQAVVIISSWKGPDEMPRPLRMMRGLHPERSLSSTLIKHTLPLIHWQMGVEAPEDVALFDELVAVHSVEQLKTQINACIQWDGPAVPVERLVHIHGDHDRLMPIGLVKDAVPIRGGTHFMVYNKAKEVGDAVKAALRAAFDDN